MDDALRSLNRLEIFYLICAITGGLFFVVRLLLQVVGFGDHDDAGLDTADVDAHHADSDAGFKVLTIQGMTAFFMMFGLVGYALYHEMASGAPLSVFGAMVAGSATVWVIGRLFSSMKKLQSSGTVGTASAVGGEGTVYLTVPAEGSGRVQISAHNRLREFDAVARDRREIRTGERIRVVGVDGDVLVVERLP